MKEKFIGLVRTDKGLTASLQQKIDMKTKPQGSLGMLEEIALKMGLIQQSLEPVTESRGMLVFASDHGVTAEGVSAFPPDVTPQMVQNFLEGGAAINVFCRKGGIRMSVIDVGVNFDFENIPGPVNLKVRKGTRNFAAEAAMTVEEAELAVEAGRTAFRRMNAEKELDILGLGEMGIGNTSSAAAIIAAVTGIDVRDAAGRGTGVDDAGLSRKVEVIEKALKLHRPDGMDWTDLLVKIGGYEIAAMAGAALAAAEEGTAVVFDGLISTAAALIAWRINPAITDFAFSGHRSVEPGQKAALDMLELKPIIDCGMRLGEGTGAALAMNIIENSCAFLREMASFGEAGVSEKI